MRVLLMLVVSCFAWAPVHAQAQNKPDAAAAAPGAAALSTYMVHITEFRSKEAADPKLSGVELLRLFEKLKNTDKVDLMETVRLSALAGYESKVQFGKTESVTIGSTQSQFGRTKTTQQRQVGTTLQVKAVPANGSVQLTLSYEAARSSGEGTADSPPDVTLTQFNTTLLLKPGVPTLVGGSTSEAASSLIVLITE